MGIGNMQIEDFITLASYIFPDDYHMRLQSLEKIDEVMHLEDFVKLLHLEHNAETQTQVSGWKGLMLKREPTIFSYTEFYNPFWFDYRNKEVSSRRIDSSSDKVEEFLNMLYEINPEIIKRYIEKVRIDENELHGRIYLHKNLKKCIKQARWSRVIDLRVGSDTIRYCLEYDKSCIEKLAEELKTEVRT
jgi:hypothetical protein